MKDAGLARRERRGSTKKTYPIRQRPRLRHARRTVGEGNVSKGGKEGKGGRNERNGRKTDLNVTVRGVQGEPQL
jgi:hypothetical protein